MNTQFKHRLRLLAATAALVGATVPATADTLDQMLCEFTYSGTWTAGGGFPDDCAVLNLTIDPTETIEVPANVQLTTAADGDLNGDLTIEVGGNLVVASGTLSNHANLNIDGEAQIVGELANRSGAITNVTGTVYNDGTVSNNGSLFVFASGSIDTSSVLANRNSGTLSNLGRIDVSAGVFSNVRHALNSGPVAVVAIAPDANLNNIGGSALFTNSGGAQIHNEGRLVNQSFAQLNNLNAFIANVGTVDNSDDALITNDGASLFANLAQGLLDNYAGGVVINRADLFNLALIENWCGGFFFNRPTGRVSNVVLIGRFKNYGGNLTNAGFFAMPALNFGCMFHP